MKIIKLLGLALFLCFATTSCSSESKEVISSKSAEIVSITIPIDGMTCAVGCARKIQSEVAKIDGVSMSDVNFEEKKGTFTFDASKVSNKKIKEAITGIAGGKLYTVGEIKKIPSSEVH